jgi:hypothetical protein
MRLGIVKTVENPYDSITRTGSKGIISADKISTPLTRRLYSFFHKAKINLKDCIILAYLKEAKRNDARAI